MNMKNTCKQLIKCAKSQGNDSLKELYTWNYENTKIICYSWYDGEAGFENKHDLPPGGISSFLEEDSSVKLLYFPLIILLIYSIDLKSYSNLDTIIYQKKRIEFEVEFLNRNYWVESNLNELLLIKDYETGKNIRWDFIIYNKKLNEIYNTKILMDRSFTLYKKQSENKDFNILYKKEYSNEKEYLQIVGAHGNNGP